MATSKSEVHFRLVSISELKFLSTLSDIEVDKSSLDIGLGFNTFANKEKKSIVISAGVLVRQKETATLLESWYAFEFLIKEFDEVVKLVEDTIQCEVDIMPTLIEKSFDTFRGILYMKTLGTKIEPFILPMVNAKFLISDKRNREGN